MAHGELPEFLKRARESAMKRMAAQLGGGPPEAPRESVNDGFEGGARRNPLLESAGSPAPVAAAGAAPGGDSVAWDDFGASKAAGVAEAHRQRVLDTATQLFAGDGYRRVSLDDVAQQAGVSRAIVGTLFATKEALLLEAVAQEIDRFLSEAQSWIQPGVRAEALLRTISARAFEYMGHHPLLLQLMLGLLSDLAPEREDRLHALRTRFVTVIREAVRIGVEQGAFRKDLDLEMTAAVLFDVHVSGYVLHQRAGAQKAEVGSRRREAALDLVLNGLRVRSP